MNKSRSIILSIALPLLVVGLVMYFTGYWTDGRKALRELKGLEIPVTPLQVRQSAASGDVDTLSLLGRAGVDFNDLGVKNEAGDYPLHSAVKDQKWEVVEQLATSGASLDVADAQGLPVTSYLLDARQFKILSSALKSEANVPHSSGQPYLIQALDEQDHEMVQFLLKQKADPNTRSTQGQSAMLVAYHEKSPEFLISLLDAGAAPKVADENGTQLFTTVCKEIPALGFSPQQVTEVVRSFVNHGADLDATDSGGWRPFQWLLHHEQLYAADLILDADPNITESLWVAIDKKNYPLARTLLQMGADPYEKHPSGGHEPLMQMVCDNQPAAITDLLNRGADPEQLGKEGQSALVTAIALKHTEAALTLLSHPSRTAGHSSIMQENVSEEFRELFGKSGYFDWYARNVKGLTPLMVAVMMKEHKVAEKLIANGANPTQGTESRSKVYPIQMAANNKDVKMQQLLIGVPYEDEQQERNFIIDLSEQKVYYYNGGELKKTSRISSGRSGFRTKAGKYVITDKTKNKRSNIYDNAEMPYFQRFSCGAIGFHEGNTYSRYASHGCIRLPMSVAKYFWGQTKLGDRVEIRP